MRSFASLAPGRRGLQDLSEAVDGASCAVVGNSARLKGSALGGAIDAHATVLRFNEAPTLGFQRDVGALACAPVHAKSCIRPRRGGRRGRGGGRRARKRWFRSIRVQDLPHLECVLCTPLGAAVLVEEGDLTPGCPHRVPSGQCTRPDWR